MQNKMYRYKNKYMDNILILEAIYKIKYQMYKHRYIT